MSAHSRLAVVFVFAAAGACATSSPERGGGGEGDAPDAAGGDAGDAGSLGVDGALDARADASECLPLRHYVFTSAVDVPLGCDANMPAQIIDQGIPVSGIAVGRASFSVIHSGANGVTHFWNLQVQVGAPIAAFGLGDDMCPGTTSVRANLGYGRSTTASNRAKLVGYSGCAGRDIAFGSYYASNGTTSYDDWTTAFTPLPGATATLTTTAPSEQLRVLGVVEGSPHQDPNTVCGTEAATIDMQTKLDDVALVSLREVVPASQGMGHRVMATAGDAQELRNVTPGAHTASLLVASDFVIASQPVTTGGCCGDGEIALLRLRLR